MSPVLEIWSHTSHCRETAPVLADGCRDLIVWQDAGKRPAWFVSPLQSATRDIRIAPGTVITGYRLKPGTIVDAPLLCRQAAEMGRDSGRIEEVIADRCVVDPDVDDAIAALSGTPATVASVARTLGVSKRTLQRLFDTAGLRPPGYWRGLGRARGSARRIAMGFAIAEAAAQYGFSDQAHLTREFRRWFGFTPGAFARRPDLAMLICQPGLATGSTAEHSSTR